MVTGVRRWGGGREGELPPQTPKKGRALSALYTYFLKREGTGHGIIINSCLVCICRYFDRRRGAALGLLATGGTVAALVFTKVYEYLLAEYGVQDAFLIIAILTSHEPSIMKDEAPTTTTLLLQNVLQVLKNPRFYFHVLSYVSRGFFFECFMTVALDFAQDAGVARADSVYVLTFYAVADAIGRLFVPYLSDYGLISNCGLLTISYLTLCLLQQAAPYVAGKYDVWALSCALGLPSGYIIVGVPQILSTEIGPKNFPIAYGFMTTATAIGSFLRPLLIGFFRDNYGSYNGLFRLIGGMLGLSFVFNLGLWITDRSKQRELADDNAGSPVMGARPITTTEEKNTHL
nr:riboflavin transporter MCH5-like [Rhipicephalus microplus]